MYLQFLWGHKKREKQGEKNESLFLKGECHEIFCHILFHESKPSGPWINRLKWFCLKVRFRKDIREISDSAQGNTAQSQKFSN